MAKFVAYLRVSTQRQGRSGLGIEAQRAAVAIYLNGDKPVAEFAEVESGKRDDRPQLAAALAACRVHGAKLVIAKLDRLSRDAHFLLGLQKAGVDFVAADMPQANSLTVGIMALVAQQEREAISRRTKEALAVAKSKGIKLGGRPGNLSRQDIGSVHGNMAKTSKANAKAADLAPVLAGLRAGGAVSLGQLAAGLNARGIHAPRGGEWSAVQVKRVLARAFI